MLSVGVAIGTYLAGADGAGRGPYSLRGVIAVAKTVDARQGRVRAHVRLDPEVLARVDAEAAKLNLSRSGLLRTVIEGELNGEKWTDKKAEASPGEEPVQQGDVSAEPSP